MRYRMGDVLRIPSRAFDDRRIVVVSDDDGGSEVVDVITQPWDEVDTAFRSSPGSIAEEYPSAALVSRSEPCERIRRLESVLRSVEWCRAVEHVEGPHCPSCAHDEAEGHAEGCALAAALRDGGA